jgi:hypothetical protein
MRYFALGDLRRVLPLPDGPALLSNGYGFYEGRRKPEPAFDTTTANILTYPELNAVYDQYPHRMQFSSSGETTTPPRTRVTTAASASPPPSAAQCASSYPPDAAAARRTMESYVQHAPWFDAHVCPTCGFSSDRPHRLLGH